MRHREGVGTEARTLRKQVRAKPFFDAVLHPQQPSPTFSFAVRLQQTTDKQTDHPHWRLHQEKVPLL
jgi:hypothetical protein